MKWIWFLISAFFLSSCSHFSKFKITEKEKIANEIKKNVAVQLCKEKRLVLCGTGGQMMNKIQVLTLCFEYYEEIGIEEGRDLLITAVNTFLDAVNADERIRPYLSSYPFQPKNLEIIIYLKDSRGAILPPQTLHVISATEGFLKYEIEDSKTTFKTVLQETYAEALLKIQKSEEQSA